MRLWHKLLLCAGIAFMLLVGINGIMNPSTILDALSITIDNATARNEVRSTYGAVQLVTALFLFLALIGRLPASLGMAVMLAHIGGVFLGRIISLGIDGVSTFSSYTPFLQQLYIIDFILTVLFTLAFLQALKSEKR